MVILNGSADRLAVGTTSLWATLHVLAKSDPNGHWVKRRMTFVYDEAVFEVGPRLYSYQPADGSFKTVVQNVETNEFPEWIKDSDVPL